MYKKRFVLLALTAALLSPQLVPQAMSDPPRSSSQQPRGVRLSIYSYFVVTNSEDGVRDRDVEVYGYYNVNNKRLWTVQKKNRIEGCVPYRRIVAGWYDHEVMFDRPSSWTIVLNGYVKDYDAGSDDDGMWNAGNLPRTVNLKAMYEQQQRNLKAQMTLAGDRKSENADLTLELGRSTLIY